MLVRGQGAISVLKTYHLIRTLVGYYDLRHRLEGLQAVFMILHKLRQGLPILWLIEKPELEALGVLWLLGPLLREAAGA